jgi:hypothetical protein
MNRDAFQTRGRGRLPARVGAVRIVVGILACMLATAAAADESYRGEIRKWREAREARLRADGGWLTVVGLFWLKEGRNTFGSGASCDVTLPQGGAPEIAGAFVLASGRTSVTLEPGVSGSIGSKQVTSTTELRPDSSGCPTCSSSDA